MPYILNKTNGSVLLTINDASLDISTSLTFVGRNYSGYGEPVNENFVKLLENFSGSTAPTKAIQGQTWFNNAASSKQLNVYDGRQFKGIANLHVGTESSSNPSVGDMWWDSFNQQLKAFSGSGYRTIGPLESATSKALWVSAVETTTTVPAPILRANFLDTPIVIVSNTEFTPSAAGSQLSVNFLKIKKGITLPDTNASGSSAASGYYFWGTASESLTAVTTNAVTLTSADTNAAFYVPFASGLTGAQSLKTDTGLAYNPSTNVLSTVASSSRYADLAERYAADAKYSAGTVLIIGGDFEVTISTERANVAVAGIVSIKPGYMMNSEAGNDETHPYIALKGRIPCKVEGKIKKGDLLVASQYAGHACAMIDGDSPLAVIGKALSSQEQGFGIIEVKV